MTSILIASIFIITILTGISLEPLIPVFTDRQAKEWLAIICAMAFVAYALYFGRLQIKNKAILAFLVYIVFSIMNAPNVIINYGAVNVANAWMFQPAFKIIVYILFFGALSLADLNINKIMKWLYWLSIGTVGFCIIQFFGLDQFYSVGPQESQINTTMAHVTGTIGNPVMCGAFLAMLLPIALHLKKWIGAFAIFSTILVLQSDMAIASAVFGAFAYLSLSLGLKPKAVVYLIVVALICVTSVLSIKIIDRSSGRIAEWTQVLKDVKKCPLPIRSSPITGMGLGSHSSFYVNFHKSQFREAHCEPLQILYELGIIGLLLVLAIVFMLLTSSTNPALFSGLIAIMVNGLGNFPFQVEPIAFLTVVFFALSKRNSP